jgi:hypothetical protein
VLVIGDILKNIIFVLYPQRNRSFSKYLFWQKLKTLPTKDYVQN